MCKHKIWTRFEASKLSPRPKRKQYSCASVSAEGAAIQPRGCWRPAASRALEVPAGSVSRQLLSLPHTGREADAPRQCSHNPLQCVHLPFARRRAMWRCSLRQASPASRQVGHEIAFEMSYFPGHLTSMRPSAHSSTELTLIN